MWRLESVVKTVAGNTPNLDPIKKPNSDSLRHVPSCDFDVSQSMLIGALPLALAEKKPNFDCNAMLKLKSSLHSSISCRVADVCSAAVECDGESGGRSGHGADQ
eukprot:6193843-Pleurochrysis_carterae.AAC.1